MCLPEDGGMGIDFPGMLGMRGVVCVGPPTGPNICLLVPLPAIGFTWPSGQAYSELITCVHVFSRWACPPPSSPLVQFVSRTRFLFLLLALFRLLPSVSGSLSVREAFWLRTSRHTDFK